MPDPITLTEEEKTLLGNVGMQMPSAFPQGSIGYEHWRGVLATVERIKTAAYAQGRADALLDGGAS